MIKDEALHLALEALEYEAQKGNDNAYQFERESIKAALEANEFNPDWDTQAVLVEEIQLMAKRIEELEANDKPYAFEASMYSNDRVKIDPVTGNVSIGTPQQEANDEPVAWKLGSSGIGGTGVIVQSQRTWVGLTNEQFLKACQLAESGNYMVAFQRIQQWLKEKNT
jgi:hypothetical protein